MITFRKVRDDINEFGQNIPGTNIPQSVYHPGVIGVEAPGSTGASTVISNPLPVSQIQTTSAQTVTQPVETFYPSQLTDTSQLFPPVSQFPQLYPNLVPQQPAPIINVVQPAALPSSISAAVSSVTGNTPSWAIPVLLIAAFALLAINSGKEKQGSLMWYR